MSDLAWWLQNFKESAFRLETLPAYSVPQEAEMLERWRRGEEITMPEDHPWLKTVRNHCGAGKTMQRVRLVSKTPTDYERFELSLYHHSVAAGEEVRILERGWGFLAEDFWLMDRDTCFVLYYDDHGAFIGDESVEATPYRQRRRLALQWSKPLFEYAARITG